MVFLSTLAIPSLRTAFAGQLSRVPKLLGAGIILLFMLGITSSAVNSESLRGLVYSLVDVGILGLLLVLALIVAACRERAGADFDRIVISFITLLGLAIGLQELVGFWAARSVGSSYNFDLALIYFTFPRMYNHLQTWTIPILAALPFVFPGIRLAKVVCIITLGVHWYILLLTGARGSIVSLLAAFTIASLLSPLARKVIFKWQFPGIVLGILLYAGLFAVSEIGTDRHLPDQRPAPVSEQKATDGNPVEIAIMDQAKPNRFFEKSVGRPMLHTSGRSGLWKQAIAYAKDNPMLGIGPMNFACKGPVGRVGSPHNLGFQILSEWGIPAAIILGMLGITLLWYLFISLKHTGSEEHTVNVMRLMVITAILAALVHLSVSNLLIAPASQIAAALVAGWLLGISPRSRQKTESRFALSLLLSATLCSMMLLPFAYREMARMPDYTDRLHPIAQAQPRLWQVGKACKKQLD